MVGPGEDPNRDIVIPRAAKRARDPGGTFRYRNAPILGTVHEENRNPDLGPPPHRLVSSESPGERPVRVVRRGRFEEPRAIPRRDDERVEFLPGTAMVGHGDQLAHVRTGI